MTKQAYVQALYQRSAIAGYAVRKTYVNNDGDTCAKTIATFILKDYKKPDIALHLANTLRDDLNLGKIT